MTHLGWVVLAVLGGCVSRSEFDRLVTERDEAARQRDEAKTELGGLRAEVGRLRQDASAARQAAGDLDREVRGLQATRVRRALGIGDAGSLRATIHTGVGAIACELWPDVAPLAVENFVLLAEGKKKWTDPRSGRERVGVPLYDGTRFHRVIKGFMIQGGDPAGDGSGGPGYAFRDETDASVTFAEPGRLAMANAGPATNGSQFFIAASAPTHLDGKHTIFGQCDLDVVRRIMDEPLLIDPERPNEPASTPIEPVRIDKVVITRRP